MASKVSEIIDGALELSPEERTEIAARLLESLEPEEGTPEEVEREWLAEVERRLDDGTPGVAWSEVRRRILERLKQ